MVVSTLGGTKTPGKILLPKVWFENVEKNTLTNGTRKHHQRLQFRHIE